MNTRSLFYWVSFTLAWLSVAALGHATGEQHVRAQIGIEVLSDSTVRLAKSRDRLAAGDKLRIYVVPKTDCFVYVVYSDTDTLALLNENGQGRLVRKDSTLILPSLEQYYQIDGASSVELFTVICSPEEIKELSTLFNSEKAAFSAWMKLESDLIETSRIVLSEEVEEPIGIAGNVRGPETTSIFLSDIPILSGKEMVLKRYEFRVKK